MSSEGAGLKLKRCNVLTFDGGGVRGLSSLLILQELMNHVNTEIRNKGGGDQTHGLLRPNDVFDFVAGTSTGGLIAIMLGKLGMDVEQCIQAYFNLSKNIFGKRHFRGRMTGGLAPTRYSGKRLEKCVKRLIKQQKYPENLPMLFDTNSDKLACAVICREHYHQSKYSKYKPDPAHVCSLECPDRITCLVSEAARATSAAPTYFPIQKIHGRFFSDGGLEYNNPSKAIFDHYTEDDRVASARGPRESTDEFSRGTRHGHLDFSNVRFINLGTGTILPDEAPARSDRMANLIPSPIRMTIFLKQTLTQFAVNSEKIAGDMRTIERVSRNSPSVDIRYVRFSANTGVCNIKMDKYKKLDEIRTKTQEYLQIEETQSKLRRVAIDVAEDYRLGQQGAGAQQTHLNPTSSHLSVPDHRDDPSREGSQATASASQRSSNDVSGPSSDGNANVDPHNGASCSTSSAIPPNLGTGQLAADLAVDRAESVGELGRTRA